MAGQLLASQRDDKPRAPSVLTYYGGQLEEFAKQRAQMRDAIAKWWTLMEEEFLSRASDTVNFDTLLVILD